MILRGLTIVPRERVAIVFLMFLGLGTIATTATCCALHIVYRRELVIDYNRVKTAELLACVELGVGISAVSLPSLRALLWRGREQRRKKSVAGEADGSKRTTPVQEWEREMAEEDEGRLVRREDLEIIRGLSVERASLSTDPGVVRETPDRV